jgi:hypothetical protein
VAQIRKGVRVELNGQSGKIIRKKGNDITIRLDGYSMRKVVVCSTYKIKVLEKKNPKRVKKPEHWVFG